MNVAEVPAVPDETADIRRTVEQTMRGCAFGAPLREEVEATWAQAEREGR